MKTLSKLYKWAKGMSSLFSPTLYAAKAKHHLHGKCKGEGEADVQEVLSNTTAGEFIRYHLSNVHSHCLMAKRSRRETSRKLSKALGNSKCHAIQDSQQSTEGGSHDYTTSPTATVQRMPIPWVSPEALQGIDNGSPQETQRGCGLHCPQELNTCCALVHSKPSA